MLYGDHEGLGMQWMLGTHGMSRNERWNGGFPFQDYVYRTFVSNPQVGTYYVSCSLNSLKGDYIGDYIGNYHRGY